MDGLRNDNTCMDDGAKCATFHSTEREMRKNLFYFLKYFLSASVENNEFKLCYQEDACYLTPLQLLLNY